jgi:hypothetical protein
MAYRTSSLIEWTSSFDMIRARCVSAVFVVMPGAFAALYWPDPPRAAADWRSRECTASDYLRASARSRRGVRRRGPLGGSLRSGDVDASSIRSPGLGFEDKAVRPSAHRFLHDLIGVVHRDDEDGHWQGAPNLPRHFDAIHLREGDIEDDEIGLQLERHGERLPSVAGFSAHDPLRVLEDRAHAVAHELVVVGDENASSFYGTGTVHRDPHASSAPGAPGPTLPGD